MLATILAIDDDPDLLQVLDLELGLAHFQVITATCGREGLEKLEKARPDLVILDINLPDLDGLSICREIRKRHRVPILMLSARNQDLDKVMGLETGADDYLGKPFNPRELLARARALLRRSQGWGKDDPVAPELANGPLRLDAAARQAYFNDDPIELTPRELGLLEVLLSHAGRAFSRQQLLDLVWGEDYVGDTRTIDTHVLNLRKKLPQGGPAIVSVRGFGYRLEV